MEVCIGWVIILLTGIGLYHVCRAAWRWIGRTAARSADPCPCVRPPRPSAGEKKGRAANAQARAFQIALLQLARAPDFRRAATVAAAAKLVPAGFRRRQFDRFRPALVEHFRRCAAAGTDRELLVESLRDLAVALGVAEFEADYIRAAVDGRTRQGTANPSPADRMAALHRDHDARLAAIRQGVANNPELQEQLLEAEDQRYREALLVVFDERPVPTGPAPAA